MRTNRNKELVRHLITKAGLSRLHFRLRKLLGQNVDHLFESSLGERFAAIYRNGVWLNEPNAISLSGGGSEIWTTETLRTSLPALIDSLGCKSLLDIGCGDFNWMKEIQLKCNYTGIDVVDEVVKGNSGRYSSPTRTFLRADATRDALPAADTILCREVLFHLSFADIRRLIANVRQSNASFFIATTDGQTQRNADIVSGDFRLLNLFQWPFLFPVPAATIPDDELVPGRALAVWRIADLPLE